MVRNYYVRRDMDTDLDTVTNKLPGAGVQTSYVHSRKNMPFYLSGAVLCSGTSRTVSPAPSPPSTGTVALCRCTARTTLTFYSTCAASSVASCPSVAPCMRSSHTRTGSGIYRTRWVKYFIRIHSGSSLLRSLMARGTYRSFHVKSPKKTQIFLT